LRNRGSKLFTLLLLPLLAGGKEKEEVTAARRAFETVEALASIPNPADVQSCIQAQREAGKIPAKSERVLIDARRMYCEFLKAALANDTKALAQSAAAMDTPRGDGKNDSAPVLKLAASIAALKSAAPGAQAEQDLTTALQSLNCLNAGFARTQTCNALDSAGRLWLGWFALRRNELTQAETAFHHVGASPWNAWLTGIYSSEGRRCREAAMAFADAAASWPIRGRSLVEWLGPQPAPGELPARLAYAQAMAGDTEAALPNLDAAISARPNDAVSLFLRGLLRRSIPDLEAAAKAAPPEQAHLYRGVLFERRREYPAATREFDQAGKDTADLAAWKSLTDAAAGACPADSNEMDKLSATATPLFPKGEYAIEIVECRLRTAMALDRLIALDASVRSQHPAAPGDLGNHFAAAYIRQGVQAEDRKDSASAVVAYRRALEWMPRNTKARFNLGALFFGDRKFDLAEAEYRALLVADPNDREAQFWLGQSILAAIEPDAKPDAIRRAEACGLLQQSIRIQDSAKRDEFAAAISASTCGN
jgi:tetratricopeptide (TPR) repeat protein